MAEKKDKKDIVSEFGRHAEDSGSMEVQAALYTERIKYLTDHLRTHKKDFSSRNGLSKLLAQRKRSLQYLKNTDEMKYQKIIKMLGLKR
jgi:small subunit ribosomal protein S15